MEAAGNSDPLRCAAALTDAQRQLLDQHLDTFDLDRAPGRALQAAIADIRQRL